MPDPISLYLHRHAGAPRPLCIMYHSVVSGRATPEWEWAISLDAFKRQLDFLRDEGWTTVQFTDLTSAKPPPPRSMAITFDDGYTDNLQAADELQRRGMCATWFLVSDRLGKSANWGDESSAPAPLMDTAAARTLLEMGMEIGSHTRRHARLPSVSADVLNEEVAGSKADLEDRLGRSVDSFAYPYGLWNAECEQAVKAAGYKCCATTRSGWALRDNDPYRIRRLAIMAGDSLSHFARKLAFADNDVSWGRVAEYYSGRLAARLPLGKRPA